MTTTIQLRRYTLKPGETDAFITWWRAVIPPLRARYGMGVPFAFLDEQANEFIWAVTVRGDRDEFDRVEAEYMNSPERAAVFADVPKRVASSKAAVVEQLW